MNLNDQSAQAHQFLDASILLNCNSLIYDLLELGQSGFDFSDQSWYGSLFLQSSQHPDLDIDEDPIPRQPYEFWIVSDPFAHKLKIHNQLLTNHWGFWIWGRETTGQSIILDYVFQKIYDDFKK